ncbi:ACT domain-containing protein [Candidatus Bathyarchaeota archaeon]|nr:ACT domain-containing protein [Candidatus Bathyarchaeota archaeon]
MKADTPLWSKIAKLIGNHPERMKVVRTLLENGLAIRDSKVFLNRIEVPVMKVARVAEVDRRTVNETVRAIEANPELSRIFGKLASAGLSLKGVARDLDLGTIEILVDDPLRTGIIARASGVLSDAGISIRQALVDDPELAPEPKLVLITNRQVPGEVITKLRAIPGVVRVSLY